MGHRSGLEQVELLAQSGGRDESVALPFGSHSVRDPGRGFRR
ncbi:hypothetical protein ACFV29_45240 [Streptomyces sp. NPDC059690]